MRTHTKETQEEITPQLALEILKEGNERFVNNIKAHRNLLQQINETKTERNGKNILFIRNVTEKNVFNVVQKITEQSPILKEFVDSKKIKIIGGLHDIDSGQVTFF